MPRINIETSLWANIRFRKLSEELGHREAIGTLVELWSLAQEYWVKNKSPIPKNVYDMCDFPNSLVELEWVFIVSGGISVRGAEERFAWLVASIENGKRGGRPSKISNITKPLGIPTEPRSNLPTPSPIPPPVPTLRNNTYDQSVRKPIDRKFDFASLYKKYPRKLGKQKGLAKAAATVKCEQDYANLSSAIDRFIEHHRSKGTEAQFIPHFSTFMNGWQDWLDPETGQSISYKIKPKSIIDILKEREAENASN